MNYENLHKIISRYEDDLENICGKVSDERFKWQATKAWQDAWFFTNQYGKILV